MALAIALAVLAVVGLLAARPGRAGQACTHGASSVGPVFFENGKFVGGDTTPATEACLP